MALRLADVVREMHSAVSKETQEGALDRVLQLAADFLVQAIARDGRTGAVAILMLATEYKQLTFAYPRHLAKGNSIPVDRDSIAGKALLQRGGVIENDVPNEPHRDFFERIPDEKGTVLNIQKMIAAPMFVSQEKAIGVIEVSRSGDTSEQAGDDFSRSDAANLDKCCQAFAPYVFKAWSAERSW